MPTLGQQVVDREPGVATSLAGFGQAPADEPPALPLPQSTIDYIKAQMADAVSSGIEEGTKRVVEKYHLEDIAKWGKAAVFAEFVTAAAAVGILLTLLFRDKD